MDGSPEKAMAPHSGTLAWKIPWMEEPSRLQSMGSLRVGHDWATSLSLFTFMYWRRKWQCTSMLAWRIPGTVEPGELLFMGLHRVGHDWSDLTAAAAGLKHTRPPCPSLTPGVYPNSCPLSWWCHPTISSPVGHFSSHLQSLPASGSFQMSQLFALVGQSIGASA